MTIGKKILSMFGLVLLTTVGTGLLYFFTLYNSTAKDLSATYRSVNIGGSDEVTQVIEAREPFTILFMGVDTGTGSRTEDWVGNSDSMILVTVNPLTEETTMMSLERDILINVTDGDGTLTDSEAKLNAAYANGGPESAIATVQDLMNIKIDRFVMINMQGMIDLVNVIGGITVNNTFDFPISIEDWEPEYTATIDPGIQTLNGDQALVYARMRYQDPEGDYGRQRRQREVIGKIIEKFLSMNGVSKYQKILDAVKKNVQTNIEINTETIPQLLGYRDALKEIKNYQLTGVDAMFNETSYQVVTEEHLLEMQNVLQTSLGKPARTSLETSALVYEDLFGQTAETPVYEGSSSSSNSASSSSSAPSPTESTGTETYVEEGSTETYIYE